MFVLYPRVGSTVSRRRTEKTSPGHRRESVWGREGFRAEDLSVCPGRSGLPTDGSSRGYKSPSREYRSSDVQLCTPCLRTDESLASRPRLLYRAPRVGSVEVSVPTPGPEWRCYHSRSGPNVSSSVAAPHYGNQNKTLKRPRSSIFRNFDVCVSCPLTVFTTRDVVHSLSGISGKFLQGPREFESPRQDKRFLLSHWRRRRPRPSVCFRRGRGAP